MQSMRHIPVQIFIAEEDPTIDIFALDDLRSAYPWIKFEVIPNAGLALIYQEPKKLISILAEAAKFAAIDTRAKIAISKPVKAAS